MSTKTALFRVIDQKQGSCPEIPRFVRAKTLSPPGMPRSRGKNLRKTPVGDCRIAIPAYIKTFRRAAGGPRGKPYIYKCETTFFQKLGPLAVPRPTERKKLRYDVARPRRAVSAVFRASRAARDDPVGRGAARAADAQRRTHVLASAYVSCFPARSSPSSARVPRLRTSSAPPPTQRAFCRRRAATMRSMRVILALVVLGVSATLVLGGGDSGGGGGGGGGGGWSAPWSAPWSPPYVAP